MKGIIIFLYPKGKTNDCGLNISRDTPWSMGIKTWDRWSEEAVGSSALEVARSSLVKHGLGMTQIELTQLWSGTGRLDGLLSYHPTIQSCKLKLTDMVKPTLGNGWVQNYFKNEPILLQRHCSFTTLFHACLETLDSCTVGRWSSLIPLESDCQKAKFNAYNPMSAIKSFCVSLSLLTIAI